MVGNSGAFFFFKFSEEEKKMIKVRCSKVEIVSERRHTNLKWSNVAWKNRLENQEMS